MSRLALSFLGAPQLVLNGRNLEIQRNKSIAILAYLALATTPIHRDTLAALLWPESDQTQAKANLRTILWDLKKKLGPEWLDSQRQTIGLNQWTDIWLDVAQFESWLQECTTHGHSTAVTCPACLPLLSDCVALYRDDFMAGFSLPDSAPFDEWQRQQAEEWQHQLIQTLQRLVDGYEAQGDWKVAIQQAQRLLRLDPWQEVTHRRLMRLYVQSGDLESARQQYAACVQILDEELGVPPQAETTQLYETLQSEWATARAAPVMIAPAVEATPVPRQTIPHNLLPQRTPFFGRQQELAEIDNFLADPACRLLTLVGLGGIGKTRLALEAAAQLVEQSSPVEDSIDTPLFAQGIYFVPLAPINSADLLVSTIAHHLQIRFYSSEAPQVQLLNFLRQKAMLLLLDNFEHLLESADFIADILAEAPQVKILATSRERLKLPEEWLLNVSGLEYPIEVDGPGNGRAANGNEYSAMQLFLQRARRVYAGFLLTGENKPCAQRICQLLEGMPLGVELAAAQVRLLSCQEIAADLEHNLERLSSQQKHMPQRHRSLQTVFEYSWHLLTQAEQHSLRCLSIFRGGFTRAAAMSVVETTPHILAALLDKSLLQRTADGRYQLHEALRQFAAEMLRQVPEVNTAVQTHHATYYLAFLRERQDQLRFGDQQLEILPQVTTEIENIRTAWDWAVDQGDLVLVEAGMTGLARFYKLEGLFQEGEQLFSQAVQLLQNRQIDQIEQVLARLALSHARFLRHLASYNKALVVVKSALQFNEIPFVPAITAGIHLEWGHTLERQSQYQTALTHIEKAIALSQEMGLHQTEADAQCVLGDIFLRQSDYEQAEGCFQKALSIYNQIGDRWGEGRVLNNLGSVAKNLGTYNKARTFFEASLSIRHQIGDRQAEGDTLNNLGLLAYSQGDYQEAQYLIQASLSISRDTGNWKEIADSLNNLGVLAKHQGAYDEAIAFYKEGLAISRQVGDQLTEESILLNIGIVLYYQGAYAEAQTFCQAGLTICRQIGVQRAEANALNMMGLLAWCQGNYDEARNFLEAGLTISRRIGDQRGEASTLDSLGSVTLHQGAYNEAQAFLKASLTIRQQIGNRHGEAESYHNLGMTYHGQGEYVQAKTCYQQALHIRGELKNQGLVGNTLNKLGHLAYDEEDLTAALDYYQQAQNLFEVIPFMPNSVECQIGLALVYQAQGDVREAQRLVNAVWDYLDGHPLAGDWSPLRVGLMCWQLLAAWQDSRADGLLQKLVRMVQTQAAGIQDEGLRHSFLENVPEHRQIAAVADRVKS